MMAATRVVFSDLDGTIIHYPSSGGQVHATCGPVTDQVAAEDGLIRLPPTHSGAVGVISKATLRLFAALRALGVKLVLISGARSSSLLLRLPHLPAADAYVCESGGRIFYHDSTTHTAAPIVEDMEWRAQHEAATGPPGQDAVPPQQRTGALWAHYAALEARGWRVDAAAYTTAFRVQRTTGRDAAELEELRRSVPPALAAAGNLGAVDFFPVGSGKEKAAGYLMARFGVTPQECVLMCDDDNDLALAAQVRAAYLPGITAPSVQAAVDAAPERFNVSRATGWRGTEEIIKHLLREHLGNDN